jgi:Family of unknown function (DUF6152)
VYTRYLRRVLPLVVSLVTVAQLSMAHHSVSGQFDPDQTLVADAILKKVEWINPHPYLTYLVKKQDGTEVLLALETAAPAALKRAGLTGKEALKVGDTYTVYYHPSRSGRSIGLMIAFALPDGHLIGANTSASLEAARKLAAERAAKAAQ